MKRFFKDVSRFLDVINQKPRNLLHRQADTDIDKMCFYVVSRAEKSNEAFQEQNLVVFQFLSFLVQKAFIPLIAE